MATTDPLYLFRQMLRSRVFEEHVVLLWNAGFITGEMHTSIGEEAINAGVVGQLTDGDALALDHRGTSPAIIRGVDPKALLLEFLGHPQGLCSGMGGHMHIFSKPYLLASSGIVGASGPAAVGFALAARQLRPGRIAVAFFGEGAVNEGMLMESFNLASAWKLPVLFICKDNGMSITTRSKDVTAGKLVERAASFAMPAREIDGTDAEIVWKAAGEAIALARSGGGPSFLLAKCTRPHGHFLGDVLLRIVDKPVRELRQFSGPLARSVTGSGGSSFPQRMAGLRTVLMSLGATAKIRLSGREDPLGILRDRIGDRAKTSIIEEEVHQEMKRVFDEVSALLEGIHES